jgi:hypothetical protein
LITARSGPALLALSLRCSCTDHHDQPEAMPFHIYAHDQGCIEYVNTYPTRSEALAHVHHIKADMAANPGWYDDACTWFEVSKTPPYRDTYQFPDMTGMG